MKVAFIGGGNMGEAMVSGLIKSRFSLSKDITVCETDPLRRLYLGEKYGVLTTEGIKEASDSEIIVLSIKPKDLNLVMEMLKGLILPGCLVISVVAGASLSVLEKGLEYGGLVRVMPNINAQVGEAISLWIAHPKLGFEQKEKARAFLTCLGREIYVDNEEYLDMATALSGSGPAYVFLFIEALIEAGVYIGLPRKLSQEMVIQTVLGSAKFLSESKLHPAEAISKVASPAGTTAEALLLLREGGFQGKVIRAVAEAFRKIRSL